MSARCQTFMNARRRKRYLTICVFAAIPLSAQQPSSAPPQPAPTFKVGVEYVEVDAVVTDKAGNIARGLTKDDFRVSEDGKPQGISSFSFIDIPAPQAGQPGTAREAVAPDVASNAGAFDGRVYVMVIDDLHALPDQGQRMRVIAHRFIEQDFGANDLMAVLHTSGQFYGNQEFTADKSLLLAAVDDTNGRSLGSATVNTRDANQVGPGAGSRIGEMPDAFDSEQANDARAVLDTLRNAAARFANVRDRRKAILFLSEGIDYDITKLTMANPEAPWAELDPGTEINPNRWGEDVILAMNAAVDAAWRNNVAIYGIDPRGLVDNGTDQTITEQNDTRLGHEVRLAQNSLRDLSDWSGGFAVVSQNDFAKAYHRIVADNSSYYLMAYYPPPHKRDGRFHKIDVRVDRPGLTVRVRRGYITPKGKVAPAPKAKAAAAADLGAALSSPIPVRDLTLDVFAAPFRNPVVTVGAAPEASVLLGIEVHGRNLPLTAGEHVDLSYMAIDTGGKTHGAHTETVTLNLRPQTKARVEESGMRILNRLALAPGHYQLRIAVRDEVSGKVGSVLYDLDVPDFGKPPLAVSGIILAVDPGAGMPTARPDRDDPRPANRLPAPPTGLRAFTPDQVLVVYAEAYDNQKVASPSVSLTTTVDADDGRVVSKVAGERVPGGGSGGIFGFTARVPVRDLPVGRYVLNVEALARGGAVGSRRIPFSVVALPGSTGPLAMVSR